MIVGIDAGKANLNAYDGKNEFSCVATYAEGVEKISSGYQMEVEGVNYLVGDETLPYDIDMSKEKEVTRLLMYLALYQLVPNEGSCTIVIGCPIDIFLNAEKKKKYREFLMKTRYPSIIIGGVEKRIFISQIIVVPESSGVVYRNANYFKGKMLGVVDIGGSTINYSVFANMNVDRDMSFTESYGMHYLRELIRGNITRECGYQVSTKELPFLMRNPTNEQIKNVIEKTINNYLEKMKKEMAGKHWSPELQLVFTGGGALELTPFIANTFRKATISETPVCDNCVGYYQLGELLCDYKKI